MNLFKSLMAAALLAFHVSVAEARPAEVEQVLPSAERVGEARYRVFALTLFDAALWAENGAFSWERPFALTLTYHQSFSARAIANRTRSEMSRRGREAPSMERLQACFADVKSGDRITGVSTGPNGASFYFNGSPRCAIEWPGFSRGFFGIWLDARGEERRLSAQLLGIA